MDFVLFCIVALIAIVTLLVIILLVLRLSVAAVKDCYNLLEQGLTKENYFPFFANFIFLIIVISTSIVLYVAYQRYSIESERQQAIMMKQIEEESRKRKEEEEKVRLEAKREAEIKKAEIEQKLVEARKNRIANYPSLGSPVEDFQDVFGTRGAPDSFSWVGKNSLMAMFYDNKAYNIDIESEARMPRGFNFEKDMMPNDAVAVNSGVDKSDPTAYQRYTNYTSNKLKKVFPESKGKFTVINGYDYNTRRWVCTVIATGFFYDENFLAD